MSNQATDTYISCILQDYSCTSAGPVVWTNCSNSHQFKEGRQTFLSSGGVPWLENQLDGSLEPYAGGRGIGYVSVLDVDNFLDHVIGSV